MKRCLPCLLLLSLLPYTAAVQAAPAVVLQSGLGDGQSAWRSVLPGLKKTGAVFAYDRAGYGATPGVSGTRDPCTIAQELHALLRKEGIAPPYVLVGHSIGGLYQYVYARLYPEDVAALVLLDPTHPQHWASMQEESPALAAIVRGINAMSLNSATRREFRDQALCLDKIDMSRPVAATVRILVSGKGEPGATRAFATMLDKLRNDWLRLSGAPRLEVVEQSGHYLQKDAPDVVIKAIEEARDGISPSTTP